MEYRVERRSWVRGVVLVAVFGAMVFAGVLPVRAAGHGYPYDGMRVVHTRYHFAVLVARLQRAIADQRMGLVAEASASAGAARRGIRIPGNAVLMVFRNDFAVRMLRDSVPAGFEAPLRLYVTEGADGRASITYRTPSAIFRPYGNADLDRMARDLDAIFARIVAEAAGTR